MWTACIYNKTEISETAFKIQKFMYHYPYNLRLTTLRNRQIIIKIRKNKDSKGRLRVHSDNPY